MYFLNVSSMWFSICVAINQSMAIVIEECSPYIFIKCETLYGKVCFMAHEQ